MCGITGFWEVPSRPKEELNEMARDGHLAHRGPDDLGAWVTKRLGLR